MCFCPNLVNIGKAGIVRNGAAVGAIAARGFFVLRSNRDRLDPHFLLAYLDGSECRSWFDAMASGSTIRHLSKQALDELPIPLPPMQLQQRVAKEHIEHGVNVLTFLAELLTEGEKDPVSEWIDKAIESLPSSSDFLW